EGGSLLDQALERRQLENPLGSRLRARQLGPELSGDSRFIGSPQGLSLSFGRCRPFGLLWSAGPPCYPRLDRAIGTQGSVHPFFCGLGSLETRSTCSGSRGSLSQMFAGL